MTHTQKRVERALVCLTLLTLAFTGGLTGQATDGDQAELRANPVLVPVYALFDGMREKDQDKILSAFVEGATLRGTGFTEEGSARLASISAATDFAGRVTQATVYIDEQIWEPNIQVNDNLATVVVKYALYVDQEFSHCGVDSMHMFKGPDGWKIFHLADTRRTEDCWEPPA